MKWLFWAVFAGLIQFSGCQQATAPAPPPGRADTTLFGGPEPTGLLTDPALTEVSGLAPSWRNPGYLWAEEDSGNPNQIQLISATGAVAGRFTLPALTNQDWEDVATGPGPIPGRSYVYLAEIGDNAAGPLDRLLYRLLNRPAQKVIYRLAEPTLAGRQLPVSQDIARVDTLTLTLPNGPHDAEALLVDPVTSDIYLLTKDKTCGVYRAAYPQSRTTPIALEPVLTLPLKKVTSAAISPDGTEILIRTYQQLFYYQRRAGESVRSALQRSPRQLPLAVEPQGEAIGWRLDGGGYYSASERWRSEPEELYLYRRLAPRPVNTRRP